MLDEYVFTEPGTYTIQAVYEATISADRLETDPSKVLPAWLFALMEGIETLLGIGVLPPWEIRYAKDYHVRAESVPVRFEVGP